MSCDPMLIAKEKGNRNILHASIAFLITLALCVFLICVMILNRINVEKLTMEQVIFEKTIKINDITSRLLNKTQMMATLVLQSGGASKQFPEIAAALADDPAILNILVAPDGIVTDVYPLEGNEAVVGFNYFSESAGNREAVMAKESGMFMLGGPFKSVQGSEVLAGRLPVYTENTDGSKRFWGFVSVTMKYPQVLESAGLDELIAHGFSYEIWRVDPDSNEKQIIAGGEHQYGSNVPYIEKRLSVENAEWYFRILPLRAWYEFPETWISFFVSICISFLVASVVQNNHDLRVLKDRMEAQSNTDPLTGVYNRRFFIEYATKQFDRNIRANSESFVIIFDLDRFKAVNDNYGHPIGDIVLKEISVRVANELRPYDLFARYGGEEFIIYATDIDTESVIRLTERLRICIERIPVKSDSLQIPVTASFGIAPAAPANKLEVSVKIADNALYRAKEEGRNKVIFLTSAVDANRTAIT